VKDVSEDENYEGIESGYALNVSTSDDTATFDYANWSFIVARDGQLSINNAE
jgi:hypothetical protein